MSDAKTKAEAIASIDRALGRNGANLLSFSGEVQLGGWNKSTHNSPPHVKLWLQDDDAMLPFEAATVRKGKVAGQLYWVFAIRLDEDERPTHQPKEGGDAPEPKNIGQHETAPAPEQSAGSGRLAYDLHRSGWFRNAVLWNAMHDAGLYTLQEHKEFVHGVGCFGPQVAPQGPPQLCAGDIVAHHCNAAHLPSAGRRRQPEAPQKEPHWYAVPLCHAHHQWIHQLADKNAKDMLLVRAIEMTAERIKTAIKQAIGIESMSTMTDEQLVGLLNLIELPEHAWPAVLRANAA